MVKGILRSLDDFSIRGFVFRRTARGRFIYLLKWAMTALACYLFYSMVVLAAFAGLLLLFNLLLW